MSEIAHLAATIFKRAGKAQRFIVAIASFAESTRMKERPVSSAAAPVVPLPAKKSSTRPPFGQDARTWAELVALLARLRDEGSAIVTITHDRDVVEALHAERLELGAAR